MKCGDGIFREAHFLIFLIFLFPCSPLPAFSWSHFEGEASPPSESECDPNEGEDTYQEVMQNILRISSLRNDTTLNESDRLTQLRQSLTTSDYQPQGTSVKDVIAYYISWEFDRVARTTACVDGQRVPLEYKNNLSGQLYELGQEASSYNPQPRSTQPEEVAQPTPSPTTSITPEAEPSLPLESTAIEEAKQSLKQGIAELLKMLTTEGGEDVYRHREIIEHRLKDLIRKKESLGLSDDSQIGRQLTSLEFLKKQMDILHEMNRLAEIQRRGDTLTQDQINRFDFLRANSEILNLDHEFDPYDPFHSDFVLSRNLIDYETNRLNSEVSSSPRPDFTPLTKYGSEYEEETPAFSENSETSKTPDPPEKTNSTLSNSNATSSNSTPSHSAQDSEEETSLHEPISAPEHSFTRSEPVDETKETSPQTSVSNTSSDTTNSANLTDTPIRSSSPLSSLPSSPRLTPEYPPNNVPPLATSTPPPTAVSPIASQTLAPREPSPATEIATQVAPTRINPSRLSENALRDENTSPIRPQNNDAESFSATPNTAKMGGLDELGVSSNNVPATILNATNAVVRVGRSASLPPATVISNAELGNAQATTDLISPEIQKPSEPFVTSFSPSGNSEGLGKGAYIPPSEIFVQQNSVDQTVSTTILPRAPAAAVETMETTDSDPSGSNVIANLRLLSPTEVAIEAIPPAPTLSAIPPSFLSAWTFLRGLFPKKATNRDLKDFGAPTLPPSTTSLVKHPSLPSAGIPVSFHFLYGIK